MNEVALEALLHTLRLSTSLLGSLLQQETLRAENGFCRQRKTCWSCRKEKEEQTQTQLYGTSRAFPNSKFTLWLRLYIKETIKET